MIDLTRLNGTHFTLNCDLIKYVEAAPDTTVTLIGGEKLIVRESPDALTHAITVYRAAVLRSAWPNGVSAPPVEYSQMAVHADLHAVQPAGE